jgi:hypothetical protein
LGRKDLLALPGAPAPGKVFPPSGFIFPNDAGRGRLVLTALTRHRGWRQAAMPFNDRI